MTAALERYPERPLDERLERTDVCPNCGGERQELPLLDLFYCTSCEASTVGPNTEPPPPPDPEQAALFEAPAEPDEPPVDEGMAWIGEEAPDE